MRCISPHARYSIQVIEGNEQVGLDQRGVMHSVQLSQPVIADFEQGGLTEWEIEAALLSFNFSGIPEGVNPLSRVSTFDTEAYVQRFSNPEKRAAVQAEIESRLRELEKLNPSEFRIVEKPASPKPWPSYDDDSIQDIVYTQGRLGISAESIRLYEVENKNRPAIIALMTEIEEGRDGDLEVRSIEEMISVEA